jgi:crossover junction endodeoxyribonuclease RusA
MTTATASARAVAVIREFITAEAGCDAGDLTTDQAERLAATLADAGLLTDPRPCGQQFRLDLPWPSPPLRSNGSHGSHYTKARIVKNVRSTVMLLAKAQNIPAGNHLTVQLHYAPGRRTRMDSHNLHPTVKAAVDALARGKRRDWVGLELVPDDTDQYVTVLAPQVHYPPEPGPRCWLTVEVA